MQKSHIMNKVLLNVISLNEICLSDFVNKSKNRPQNVAENVWMWDDGTNILWDNGDVISISKKNGWMWDDLTNILWDNNDIILI